MLYNTDFAVSIHKAHWIEKEKDEHLTSTFIQTVLTDHVNGLHLKPGKTTVKLLPISFS